MRHVLVFAKGGFRSLTANPAARTSGSPDSPPGRTASPSAQVNAKNQSIQCRASNLSGHHQRNDAVQSKVDA
jgi:hypothetical protein